MDVDSSDPREESHGGNKEGVESHGCEFEWNRRLLVSKPCNV
jgi:hypothetical protein